MAGHATAPKMSVISRKVISHESGHYHGWPTLCRSASGQLLLSYSGGRESHVCPFGRVELMKSNDEGKTWTYPQVVIDSAIAISQLDKVRQSLHLEGNTRDIIFSCYDEALRYVKQQLNPLVLGS